MTLPLTYQRIINGSSARFLALPGDYGRTNLSAESTALIPVCEGDWQPTVDTNGEPYPAGLKQVRFKNQWDYLDIADMNLGTPVFDFIVAVPATLPAGYTQSFLRFERNTTANAFGLPFGPTYLGQPLIRTASAFEVLPWYTDAIGNFASIIPYSDFNDANWLSSLSEPYGITGFRYARFSLTQSNPFDDDMRIEIRRNSANTVDDPGDTVLWSSGTIAAGSGAYDSGTLFSGIDGDFSSPTLGERWFFNITIERWNGAAWITVFPGETDFTYQLGPRLDIPLPWVVTGANDVVPGGIPAGLITGY